MQGKLLRTTSHSIALFQRIFKGKKLHGFSRLPNLSASAVRDAELASARKNLALIEK